MIVEIEQVCQPMPSTLIADYQLESEYKVSELREAVFQMRHLSE